jgi:hypothetical protein
MKLGGFTKIFIYASVALMTGLGLSEAVIALQILGPRTEVDQTVLEQRIASAREISRALSTPLPPLEPLPVITAQLANSRAVRVASPSSARNPWSKTNSLPPEALDAMAKSLTTGSPELTGSLSDLSSSVGRNSASRSASVSLSNSQSSTFDRAAGSSGF